MIKKTPKKQTPNYLKYAENVLNGNITACNLIKKACTRFIDDFEHGHLRGIYFDDESASRAIEFFGFVPHIKGEWAGHPLKLELWEEFFVANIFGWKKSDGLRRFRTGYLEVARKNGKSSLLAGLGLYLTKFDDEPGSEVYSAATTRDQAKLVFNIAMEMVKRSKLKNHLRTYQSSICCEDTASKFMPLSSDFNSLDGLNIHGCVIDELHAHTNRELYDVLKTATGARRNPILISITTAGYDRNSICWELHCYTEKILDRVIDDDSFFGMIYTLDEGDNWEDESVWIKANPNLNVSVKIDDLKSKVKTAKEMPSELNSFMRKHMDVWTESVTRWIPVEKWNLCSTEVDESTLVNRICYTGLDLSSTTDITALVHVFPPETEGGKYQTVCRFFIPEKGMRERSRRDRVQYDVWVREGLITATDGDTVDYDYIIATLAADKEKFDIRELAFDRWGSQKIITDLCNQLDFTMDPKEAEYGKSLLVQFGQGTKSMSSPTKELGKLVNEGRLAHGGNPVLTWMASNVVISADAWENIKPDKAASTEKIDGIVAMIMGLDRAMRHVTMDRTPEISFI